MRRHDREITDRSEMESLLRDAKVCRLGCDDNGMPYIVPVSFGYREGAIYIHSAHEGRKISLLKNNPACCVEVDECRKVVRGKIPAAGACTTGVSSAGEGRISLLKLKRSGTHSIIMQHYGAVSHPFSEKELESVCVIRIDIAEMTGKKYGDLSHQ